MDLSITETAWTVGCRPDIYELESSSECEGRVVPGGEKYMIEHVPVYAHHRDLLSTNVSSMIIGHILKSRGTTCNASLDAGSCAIDSSNIYRSGPLKLSLRSKWSRLQRISEHLTGNQSVDVS